MWSIGLLSFPGWSAIDVGLRLSIPLGMALILFYNLAKYDDDHRLAWALATFVAGIGNFGVGSIVVGLLYHTVE